MTNNIINKLKKKSKLVKNKTIQRILQEELSEYEISGYQKEKSVERLINPNDGTIVEMIFGKNNIYISKYHANSIECINISNKPDIKKRYCVKRKEGIVFKDTYIEYGFTDYSTKEKYPIYIIQNEYLIRKEELLTDEDFKKFNINKIYRECLSYLTTTTIESMSEYKSTFATHEKYYISNNEETGKTTIYSNYTYSNGKNISHLYDIVNGPNKLLRIFDLYKGKVSERDIDDIRNIHLGLLNADGFGYRETSGVKEKTSQILSDRLTEQNNSKIKEISTLLSDENWYNGELKSLDRKSLISAIKYVPTQFETAKHNIEKVVGIPYNEFENLDIEQQEKLIEEKTGKKIFYPNSSHTEEYKTIDKDNKLFYKKPKIFQKKKH